MSEFKLPPNIMMLIAGNILNNTSESIYFKDLESRFIASNQYMAEYFGVTSPEDLIGKTDFDYFSKEHAI